LPPSPYSNGNPSPSLPDTAVAVEQGRICSSAPPIVLEAVGRAAPAMAPEPARMGKEEREPCRLLVHLVLPFFSVPHLRVQIIHEAGRTNGQLGIDKATEKWNTS